MGMRKIKLSHNYVKIDNVNIEQPVKLLQIFVTDKSKLSSYFIDYDTKYHSEEKCLPRPVFEFYKLPKGTLLVLLFQDYMGNLFTTVRRHTPEKEKYYYGCVGNEFKIKKEVK